MPLIKGTASVADSRALTKALRSTKFPESFSTAVDLSKINKPVLAQWVENKITEILGFEDEIVQSTAVNLFLPSSSDEAVIEVDPRKAQIDMAGFLGDDEAAKFAKELWDMMADAQKTPLGIPTKLLKEKKKELAMKQHQQNHNAPPPQQQRQQHRPQPPRQNEGARRDFPERDRQRGRPSRPVSPPSHDNRGNRRRWDEDERYNQRDRNPSRHYEPYPPDSRRYGDAYDRSAPRDFHDRGASNRDSFGRERRYSRQPSPDRYQRHNATTRGSRSRSRSVSSDDRRRSRHRYRSSSESSSESSSSQSRERSRRRSRN
ncbi:serine/arginine repetitive matrix protein 1 [Fistulifera solaris]|uniref:Serine/arginine repetitive matrix protein 1 n=1 Tax=Fistulifera solaris TaxID=1519565 RepID=A0A1Z5JM96_FISSO|nr:serine/arginine repetitive matrix protein 1 [Fistulifera solaris]|eukprot:GAX15099.1 serine/arginine repetitive matrix protein 1 [Fistulifera solaris]